MDDFTQSVLCSYLPSTTSWETRGDVLSKKSPHNYALVSSDQRLLKPFWRPDSCSCLCKHFMVIIVDCRLTANGTVGYRRLWMGLMVIIVDCRLSSNGTAGYCRPWTAGLHDRRQNVRDWRLSRASCNSLTNPGPWNSDVELVEIYEWNLRSQTLKVLVAFVVTGIKWCAHLLSLGSRYGDAPAWDY